MFNAFARPPTGTESEAPGDLPPPEARCPMWLRGLVLGVDPPDLPHAPLHGLVDARAARHAREHVGDDERGEHLLRGGRHRPGGAEERCDLVLLLERPELRVLPEPRHRLVVPAAEGRDVVAPGRPPRLPLAVSRGPNEIPCPGGGLRGIPD